ncbi:MAG: hypothetical protein ACKVOU_08085 [Cytophagales bacterium]
MLKNRIFDISIFVFCFAIIVGGAYNTYVHFDFSHSPDTKSYMKMAVGDFDVNVTHRYRVIIPFLAGSLASTIDFIYPLIWKTRGGFDWSLRLAFFIINSILVSFSAFLIFKICHWHKVSLIACMIAVIAFLSSRWAFYIAGMPYIDSLYLVVVFSLIYGLLNGNQWLICFALLIGLVAKESFLLFVPIAFYFNRQKIVLNSIAFMVGVGIFYVIRLQISAVSTSGNIEGFQNAINHLENIQYSLFRMLSIKGLAEIFFTFGVFNFFFFYSMLHARTIAISVSPVLYCILPIVGVHILLSGDVGRMLYISAPYFCTTFAIGAEVALMRINRNAESL